MSTDQQPLTDDDAAASPPAVPPVGSFIDHRKIVLDLSNDLRALIKYANDIGLAGTATEIGSVLARMAAEKFSVAVVGEFNRGKSTFINALLGTEVLPMDVMPTTATLNRVTYGFQKRATILFRDGKSEEVAHDALPAYITKLSERSEQVASTVKEAIVYYPSPYCHNNVDVIDTPGLNEDPAMTEVTLTSLTGADAAIMMILAQAPFGEHERDFLENRLLTADLGRVLFVVNGLDRLNSPADVPRVLAGIERRIEDNVMKRAKKRFGEDSPDYHLYRRKIGKPKVFGISAREALEAKRTNDLPRLQRSGFPDLETSLQRFLTEHRGVVMLQVPLNRCISAARDVLDAVAAAEGALSLKADEFERACHESEAEVAAVRQSWDAEKKRLSEGEVVLRHQARELAKQYIRDYQAAGLEAMGKTPVTPADIADDDAKQRLHERVAKEIDSAVSIVGDDYAAKMERLVAERLVQEGERLAELSQRIQQLIPTIRRQFTGESGTLQSSSVADRVVDGVSFLVPVVAGGLSGYRLAGAKGVLTGMAGGVAGGVIVGTTLAIVSTMVALPALPFILAIGGGSFIGGRLLTKRLLSDTLVQRYMENLRQEFVRHLRVEMPQAHVEAEFERTAATYFDSFHEQVAAKSEAALADGMSLIAKRRSDVVREQTNVAGNRERLAAIRAEAAAIAQRARSLSGQLVQFSEV